MQKEKKSLDTPGLGIQTQQAPERTALTNFKVLDLWANFHHSPCSLVSQDHWLLEHKVSNSAMLPVMHVWSTDPHRVHVQQNI